MSELKVNKISPRSGTDVTLGDSGDAISVASGASLTSPGLTLSDNILFNAASKGIYLGVTSATASNLLDDYEEGTHTATLTPSTSGSLTSDGLRDTLAYTKVGRVVHVQGFLDDFTPSSAVGYVEMSLPFTISNTLSEFSDRSCPTLTLNGVLSANISNFVGIGVEGADHIRVYLGDATAVQSDSAQQWLAGTQMHVSFTYITDA
jgi:hypothetical protein